MDGRLPAGAVLGYLAGGELYRVQLADKSESRVGIWVYRKVDGQIGATVVVYGADSVPQRNQERFDLYQTYEGLLQTLDLNLIASDIDPP